MIWLALYIVVSLAFTPFTCRHGMDWLESGYGMLSTRLFALCMIAGVVTAFLWPIVLTVGLVTWRRV